MEQIHVQMVGVVRVAKQPRLVIDIHGSVRKIVTHKSQPSLIIHYS